MEKKSDSFASAHKGIVSVETFAVKQGNRLAPDRSRPTTGWDPQRARVRYRKLLDSLVPDAPRGGANYERLHPFVESLLSRLEKREADVLRKQYGVDDGYPKTWQEISVLMQISPTDARELSEKALSKLLFILTCRSQVPSRN